MAYRVWVRVYLGTRPTPWGPADRPPFRTWGEAAEWGEDWAVYGSNRGGTVETLVLPAGETPGAVPAGRRGDGDGCEGK